VPEALLLQFGSEQGFQMVCQT